MLALKKAERRLAATVQDWAMPTKGVYRNVLTIGELDFAIADKSHGNSGVFYRPLEGESDEMIPGNIEEIVSVELKNESVLDLLFIRPLRSLGTETDVINPFANFPGLGASLWCVKASEQLDVVTTSMPMHPYAQMRWTDEVVVIKDLSRVSQTYR